MKGLLVEALDMLHYTVGITKPKPHQYGLFALLWVAGTVVIFVAIGAFAYLLMASLQR